MAKTPNDVAGRPGNNMLLILCVIFFVYGQSNVLGGTPSAVIWMLLGTAPFW